MATGTGQRGSFPGTVLSVHTSSARAWHTCNPACALSSSIAKLCGGKWLPRLGEKYVKMMVMVGKLEYPWSRAPISSSSESAPTVGLSVVP